MSTGGSRGILFTTLVNNGTIRAQANLPELTLGRPTATPVNALTNNGSIFVESGASVRHTHGRLDQNNGGTLRVVGAFEKQSGEVNFNGDATTMTGTFRSRLGTVNFSGGTLTGTAVLIGGRLNLASTNQAVFAFQGSTNNNLSGNVAAGQTIRVQTTAASGNATLRTPSLTNAGTIVLENLSGDAARTTTLNLQEPSSARGTLTNAATGTVTTAAGAGKCEIAGHLNNQGTVDINTNTDFSFVGAQFTNSNSVNITPAGHLRFPSEFPIMSQNAGTLAVGGRFTLGRPGAQNPSIFDYNGGTIPGGPVPAPILSLARTAAR